MSMADSGMTESEAVLAADDARLHALIASDVDALERLLCDDLVFVHANGRRDDKLSFLDDCRSGHIRYRSIARRDPLVTIAGDVAVLCASADMEVTVGGEARSATARTMSVWTKTPAGWKLFAIDMVRPATPER